MHVSRTSKVEISDHGDYNSILKFSGNYEAKTFTILGFY